MAEFSALAKNGREQNMSIVIRNLFFIAKSFPDHHDGGHRRRIIPRTVHDLQLRQSGKATSLSGHTIRLCDFAACIQVWASQSPINKAGREGRTHRGG